MKLFTKLFGIAPSQESSAADTAWSLVERQCFCAALYCAANILEKDPNSSAATAAFQKALGNVFAITARHFIQSEHLQQVQQRVSSHAMSEEEALDAADFLVRNFYYDAIIKKLFVPTLQRNVVFTPKTMGVARFFAAALADDEQTSNAQDIRWRSQLTDASDSLLAAGIQRERDALLLFLNMHSAAELPIVCRKVQDIYRKDLPEAAAVIGQKFDLGLAGMSFAQWCWSNEKGHIDTAVIIMSKRYCLREPVC